MRANGFTFPQVFLGSNLNEISTGGDSEGDQKAIRAGYENMDEVLDMMKKIKIPTIGSLLIFVIFIMHRTFYFDDSLSFECHRKATSIYNSSLGLPISIVLLVAAILSAYNFRKEIKNRIFDYLLISIVFVNFLGVMMKVFIGIIGW